ncbi:MAG: hypothetical protein RLZZ499_3414 [Cyanobacteriota bacterium]|jgi:hypothetical protein
MLTGILLGVVVGVITGLIPGFNLSLFFLLAYQQRLETSLLFYFFLVGAITNTLVGQITMLTPVAVAGDPIFLKPMNAMIKLGLGQRAVAHAFYSFAFNLALVLACGIVLIFAGEIEFLSLSKEYITLSFCLATLLWIALICLAENKILTILYLIIVCSLSFLTIEKFPDNSMLILATALYGIGFGFTTKPVSIPPQYDGLPEESYWSFTQAGVGFFGGYLIGLPTSAMCAVIGEETDDPNFTIATTSQAKGTAMGMGLLFLLTNTGARDTASTYISFLKLDVDPGSAIAILFFLLLLILFLCEAYPILVTFYIRVMRVIPPNLVTCFVLSLNIFTLFHFVGWITPVLVLIGFSLAKLVEHAGIPPGASLCAISIVPIYSLFSS